MDPLAAADAPRDEAELLTLRFVEARYNVAIVGPVGVGKTFLAHALGHIATRRSISTLVVRGDRMLKALRHARLDNSYDAEVRRLLAPDVLPWLLAQSALGVALLLAAVAARAAARRWRAR